MAGKTIEDILIDKDYKKVGKLNKKKNNGNKKNIFLILFLGALIVALIVLGIFAWKYIEDSRVVTSKELFLEHALDNNFSSLLENKLYEESYKKLGKENFYMDTKLNFSTTSEIEGFENFDFSKFSLDNNLIRNAADNKVYTDSIIKYLGNDIFDLKTISQADNFAINSEQIVTKYISGNTDQMNNLIKEVTGYDLNVNFGSAIVNNIATSEKIELTDKNVSSVAKKIIKNVTGIDTPVGYGDGVCDSNYIVPKGKIPTVCYGPAGGNMHAADEWVDVENIKTVLKVYLEFLFQ